MPGKSHFSGQPLVQQLRGWARELGFSQIGIAEVDLAAAEPGLLAWLQAGFHGSMGYMAAHGLKRARPAELVPGTVCVITARMDYLPRASDEGWIGREQAAVQDPQRAVVSIYARGRDYHKVMGRKLKELAGWLTTTSGAASRTFVDTGPVLERAWAERAGLGWIGKNANLLTRDLGSWILLGEVLTCAVLEADAGPHEDFCGTCTACLDACPTGAITSPGVVDSNACISYWTIAEQLPGERGKGLH